MNVFGFALKWRECRLYMQYKDCGLTVGLSEEFLPSLRCMLKLKNYRKYRQQGTSLNKNKQWEISLGFSYIVMKGEINAKKHWFQLTTSFRLLQLIAQSIFVRFWKPRSQNLSWGLAWQMPYNLMICRFSEQRYMILNLCTGPRGRIELP